MQCQPTFSHSEFTESFILLNNCVCAKILNMSSNRSRRHQPYDLNNPLNWTVSKLKSEIAKKGLNLTANITKPALLQIYQQLDTSVNASENSGNSSQSDQQITMPPPNEDNLNTNILGVVSGVQTAVLSLQQTVNQLLPK